MFLILKKNWFLITLLLALMGGYAGSRRFSFLADASWLNWSIVAITMFLMAWPLEFGNLQRTMSRPLVPILGCLLNIVAIPMLVWPLVGWVGGDFGGGMMVAAATPCTLASAAVWTRRAGGDDSVALMVTILTNATCFIVMPSWIYVQTGKTLEPSLLIGTTYRLFMFVVLPIAISQMVRLNGSAAKWATQQKRLLSTLALIGILTMVFIGAVNMGMRMEPQEQAIQPFSIGIVGLLMGLVHVVVLGSGMGIAKIIGAPREQWIAVGFSGSQKTLMIGLTVSVSLGVSIIPIVLYHAIQLIIDTLIADRLGAHRPKPTGPC